MRQARGEMGNSQRTNVCLLRLRSEPNDHCGHAPKKCAAPSSRQVVLQSPSLARQRHRSHELSNKFLIKTSVVIPLYTSATLKHKIIRTAPCNGERNPS